MVHSAPAVTSPGTRPLSLAASGGVRLQACVADGVSPGLLLAHGFGQTSQAWLGTQRRLAESGRASLAWDLRGHGQSGRNPADQPYRGEQFVDDVVLAAAALGAAPVLDGRIDDAADLEDDDPGTLCFHGLAERARSLPGQGGDPQDLAASPARGRRGQSRKPARAGLH